jgi:GH24 family phage-related lysozyme (muramidase)
VTVLVSLQYALIFAQVADFPTVNRLPPGELIEEARELPPQGFHLRPLYQRGIALTKLSEGWVPHLYNDAVRYCTIGYGHLIQKAPCNGTEPKEFRNGITKLQGGGLLVGDLASSQYAVMSNVKVALTDAQFAALTDFVFNVGSGNFQNSTLLKAVNSDEMDRVPGQLRRWVYAGDKLLTALQTRREREIDLFFEGLPKPKGLPLPNENQSPIDVNRGE